MYQNIKTIKQKIMAKYGKSSVLTHARQDLKKK